MPAEQEVATIKCRHCGLRWIVDTLREGGVPVRRFVATGGLPHQSPLFLQICADTLGEAITVPASRQGPALGSAILGALAAGCFPDAESAIRAMTGAMSARTVKPQRRDQRAYEQVYLDYRRLASLVETL